MTETTIEAYDLPLHITKLESPEGFQKWKHQMKQYLLATDLWKWTKVENKDAPTAEISTLANDGSNQLVRTAVLEAPEESLSAWEQGNKIACNAIKSRLGDYYFYDFKNEKNAYKLWSGIHRDCIGTLNDVYRRLITHSLESCKDAADYAGQFKDIYNDILSINPKLQLETNFLIFLFHTGLGKEYQDYFTTYTQTHEAIKDGEPAYSLRYATTRFLQTVGNPTSARDESTFHFATHSFPRLEAFVGPADLVILPSQVNAVPGPNARTIQKLVNWCTHCEKPYHTRASCNYLTKKKQHQENKDNKDNMRSKNRIQGGSLFGNSNEKDKHRNKRPRYESSSDEAWAATSTVTESSGSDTDTD